jgi:RNA polymerase sigma-70 factor, ECF subfamily
VQEVFVGLARARPALADVLNLRAYLFAALRNAAAKAAARSAAERRQPLPADLAAPVTSEVDSPARLGRALSALPAEQRELIALKIDGGLTFREIAAALGISANTAASRYRYALAKLRNALQGADP